jgi:hypothetical protein
VNPVQKHGLTLTQAGQVIDVFFSTGGHRGLIIIYLFQNNWFQLVLVKKKDKDGSH